MADIGAATAEFYRALDAGEFDRVGEMLAPDAELMFNDRPPIHGSEAILNLARALQGKAEELIHTIERTSVDSENQVVTSEQTVTYVFHSGVSVSVLAANIMTFADERIRTWRIYADMREVDANMP